MFVDLSNLKGKLILASLSFILSCLGIASSITFLSSKLSSSLKMKLFIFLQEFIVLCVYIYKYSQVGFEFAQTHYYWQESGIIICAMGYLSHFIIAAYSKLLTKSELIHHLVSLGMMYICIHGDYVQLGNLTNFMFQLSHPGYALRLLLKELELKKTVVYEIIEIYYFSSYVLLRPIGGLYLLYRLIYTEGTEICIVLSVMMWFYVTYFGIQMIPALQLIICKIYQRRRKGIRYYWIEDNFEDRMSIGIEENSKSK